MGKTYMTSQINESPTITEVAGADVEDVRGMLMKYDASGNVIPASVAGEKVIGMAIITNNEDLKEGQDVDIQVKEIGLAKAGAAIKKGDEVMAGADGKAAVATAGMFVIGTALESAEAGQLFYIQVSKFYKAAAAAG